MVSTLINAGLLCLLTALVAGSLLNLSSSPHWFVRAWDFPRVQIVVVGWILAGLTAIVQPFLSIPSLASALAALAMAIFLTGWHGFRIYPYTILAAKQAKGTDPSLFAANGRDPASIRLVFSNVKMENRDYERWMRTMLDAEPDVILALETDQSWVNGIGDLLAKYEHQILVPQDNWYGMVLLSHLPIERHQTRYLVQEDIPSINADIRLNSGELIRLVAVHPRPPEPIRDTDSVARDAELILWSQELADEPRPTIIGGDLNDVAWSQTTRLFMRISGLLDPRRGRGLFNSFDANRPYMRFPLDHVFHSSHFTVSGIQRLPNVGSDHFPILIDLRHALADSHRHEPLEQKSGDEEEAEERIERAIESDETQGEAVDGSKAATDGISGGDKPHAG